MYGIYASQSRKNSQQRLKLKDVNFWIKSICNYLWWCASNCKGDKDVLEESWISIVHHIR